MMTIYDPRVDKTGFIELLGAMENGGFQVVGGFLGPVNHESEKDVLIRLKIDGRESNASYQTLNSMNDYLKSNPMAHPGVFEHTDALRNHLVCFEFKLADRVRGVSEDILKQARVLSNYEITDIKSPSYGDACSAAFLMSKGRLEYFLDGIRGKRVMHTMSRGQIRRLSGLTERFSVVTELPDERDIWGRDFRTRVYRLRRNVRKLANEMYC